MVFEHIEQLKSDFTDKYVIVDADRPELRRFVGLTGTVRTVNMSGRALVEFEAYNNIAWYDIDLGYLKVIDEPLPKPEPAAKKKAAPKAEKAKPAKAGAAKKAGMSMEEMLAAARGEKSGGAAKAKPEAKAAKPAAMSVEEMLAAARGEKADGGSAAPKPAEEKAAPKKAAAAMSVEEMLAAARGEKAAASAAPEVEEPVADEPPVEEAQAEPEAEAAVEEDEPEESVSDGGKGGGSQRDNITTVEEQVAYCRKVDAQ